MVSPHLDLYPPHYEKKKNQFYLFLFHNFTCKKIGSKFLSPSTKFSVGDNVWQFILFYQIFLKLKIFDTFHLVIMKILYC